MRRSRADGPYRLGDDHSTVKIKNYRSADCAVGIDEKQKQEIGNLRSTKGEMKYDNAASGPPSLCVDAVKRPFLVIS